MLLAIHDLTFRFRGKTIFQHATMHLKQPGVYSLVAQMATVKQPY